MSNVSQGLILLTAGGSAQCTVTTGSILTANESGTTVVITGVGTAWLSGTAWNVTGVTGAAITVTSNNVGAQTATLTVTASTGANSGTLTFSNNADSSTCTATVLPLATGVTLSGPSSGFTTHLSTNFTVGLTPSPSGYAQSVTVTPSDGGAGGTFTPTSRVLPAETSAPTATFTYQPAAAGAISISVTNNRSLSNGAPITYTVVDFTPATVTSATLAQWLKADVGVYSDAGITPAANGGTIQQWNDQSGNGWHVSQGTAGTRPTYQAPIHSDTGAIVFTTKYLESSGATFVNAATALTIFMIMEQDSSGIVLSCNSGGSGLEFNVTGGGGMHSYFTTRGVDIATTSATAWLHELDYDGSQSTNATKYIHRANNVARTASGGGTVPTALPSNNGIRIGNSAGSSAPWTGKLREVVVLTGVLSAGDRADLVAYFQRRHAQGTRKGVVCVGDSLTAGLGGTPYPDQLQTSLGTDYQVSNMGIQGVHLDTEWVANRALVAYPTASHTLDAEVVLIGRNDLAASSRTALQMEADFTTYWAARRAAGYRIVACTVYASTFSAPQETERAALNTWMRTQSSAWDVLVDLAADARLADNTDLTYFGVDQVHLNSTGYGVVAGLVQPVVLGLSGIVPARRRANLSGGFAALTGGI